MQVPELTLTLTNPYPRIDNDLMLMVASPIEVEDGESVYWVNIPGDITKLEYIKYCTQGSENVISHYVNNQLDLAKCWIDNNTYFYATVSDDGPGRIQFDWTINTVNGENYILNKNIKILAIKINGVEYKNFIFED